MYIKRLYIVVSSESMLAGWGPPFLPSLPAISSPLLSRHKALSLSTIREGLLWRDSRATSRSWPNCNTHLTAMPSAARRLLLPTQSLPASWRFTRRVWRMVAGCLSCMRHAAESRSCNLSMNHHQLLSLPLLPTPHTSLEANRPVRKGEHAIGDWGRPG